MIVYVITANHSSRWKKVEAVYKNKTKAEEYKKQRMTERMSQTIWYEIEPVELK